MLKLKLQCFSNLTQRTASLEKTLMLGKIEGRRRDDPPWTEDEMVGWHHWLNGREFEQAPGAGDGQGDLACYSPWVSTKSQTQLRNWTELILRTSFAYSKWSLSKELISIISLVLDRNIFRLVCPCLKQKNKQIAPPTSLSNICDNWSFTFFCITNCKQSGKVCILICKGLSPVINEYCMNTVFFDNLLKI